MFERFKIWLKRLLGLADRGEVDYLTGADSLPGPLSAEREAELTMRLADGDVEARNELIEHNLRLVIYIAKKFDSSGVDMDDLISVGTIGLIKAVKSFDGSKKIKLATYASRCIENEILMQLRKSVRTKAEMSLDEPLNVDWEGNVLLLSDVLGTESDTVGRDLERDEEKSLLMQCLQNLDPREKQIIKMRFGVMGAARKTQKEIADIMGISQSYISRLEKKVMTKLKRDFDDRS